MIDASIVQRRQKAQPASGQPLEGLRIVDISRVLAGPFSGMVLADLGADVIKVEHPARGDDTRDWGTRIGKTETSYFYALNRNKRSITADLKLREAQEIVKDLVRDADVFIENFRLGGADKLNLGYEHLKKINPQLIYCSITGYDPTGAEAERPGYDLVVQGEAGLMAMNGEAGRPPVKFGVAAVDLFTGMYSAQAIMAALLQRSRTGKGRHIQMALYDCGLMLTSYYGMQALVDGKDPPRVGNEHPSIMPYGVFEAADGPLVITVGTNAQYVRFCKSVIRRPELVDDPRFKTNLLRSANRAEFLPILNQELSLRRRAELLRDLIAAEIPCGEVVGLSEALTSRRAREGGLVVRPDHPEAGGPVPVLAPPYRFDGERCPVRLRPPMLGEHTESVLRDVLGRSDTEIRSLREAAVI